MMKVFCPSNGKKIEVKLDKARGFFWCDCESSNIFELRALAKKTKVDFFDLRRGFNSKGNSRLISRKDYDMLLLKYPVYNGEKILLENINIVFNKKFVLTVYNKKIKPLRDFTKNIGDELVGVKKKDYFYFLQRIFATLVKEFMLMLDKIEVKIDKIEEGILNHKTQTKNLSLIRKDLLNVRKALVANRNIMGDLEEGASKFFVPNKITHIYADINQILDTEELFRDRLTNTLNLYMSFLSNKMNNVMKSFTVIASLLLIPMLVSSIYGMNVRLPLQSNTNAFYTIMLLVLLSVITTLLYFKSKKWI